jgi:RNA polymerase sigma factor (sigma-70 family)
MRQWQAEDRIDTKPPDIARLLLQYLEQDASTIISIFRNRVRKAGLASKPEEVQEVALELLNEVYIEATKTAHSFDPARPPRAWLLGIATHIISKKRAEQAKHKSEIPLSALPYDHQEAGAVLTLTSTLINDGMERQIEARAQAEYLLSLVSATDREVLHLSIIEGLDGEELAQRLGCAYTAAQVRLCRARARLRVALQREGGAGNE